MALSLETLAELPDAFYRVSVKALVFDDQQRLLLYVNNFDRWEVPGGGLEYGETIEDCIRREMREEVGLEVVDVSPVQFVYSYTSTKGYNKCVLAVRVAVADFHPIPQEENVRKAWYASREEIAAHEFRPGETGTKLCIEQLRKVWI